MTTRMAVKQRAYVGARAPAYGCAVAWRRRAITRFMARAARLCRHGCLSSRRGAPRKRAVLNAPGGCLHARITHTYFPPRYHTRTRRGRKAPPPHMHHRTAALAAHLYALPHFLCRLDIRLTVADGRRRGALEQIDKQTWRIKRTTFAVGDCSIISYRVVVLRASAVGRDVNIHVRWAITTPLLALR